MYLDRMYYEMTINYSPIKLLSSAGTPTIFKADTAGDRNEFYVHRILNAIQKIAREGEGERKKRKRKKINTGTNKHYSDFIKVNNIFSIQKAQ